MITNNTVGVVGVWSALNYGSELTYYALYQVLKDEKKNVLMLEQLPTENHMEETVGPELFHNNPYPLDSLRMGSVSQMQELNEVCDTFVVGSDQLWRYRFFKKKRDANLLSFVSANKRKISYATSFGEKVYSAPPEYTSKMLYFLNRFHKISVREKSGVDICNNTFGIDVEWVLDPVFLCDIRHYEALIQNAKVSLEEPFIFVYLVHPTKEKKEFIKEAVLRMGKKAVFVRSPNRKTESEDWDTNFEDDCKVEDLLYYIKQSDRVITDSFHGYCFSIIFNKQIIPMFQTVGGDDSAERTLSLMSALGIEGSVFMTDVDIEQYCSGEKDIIYKVINKRLDAERKRCRQWLLEALDTEVTYDKSDLLWDAIRPEIYKMRERELQQEEAQRERKRLENANRNIVLFGTGKIFLHHRASIMKRMNICSITDNNPDKWGREYDGIVCVSPEELKSIDNPYVLITVSNEKLVDSIRLQLSEMGIEDVAKLSEWMDI